MSKNIMKRLDSLDKLLDEGKFEDVIGKLTRMEIIQELSQDEDAKLSAIWQRAIAGILAEIKNNLHDGKYDDAIRQFALVKGNRRSNTIDEFNKEILDIEDKLITYYVEKLENIIIEEKWNDLCSASKEISENFDENIVNGIKQKIKEKIKNKITELSSLEYIHELKALLTGLSNCSLCDKSFIDELKTDLYQNLETQIRRLADNRNFDKADSFINEIREIFAESNIQKLEEDIKSLKVSEQIDSFQTSVINIREAINNENYTLALNLLSEAEKNPQKDEETISELRVQIQQLKEDIEEENKKYRTPQPLHSMGWFNVPKPGMKDEGEDADPYINVSPSQNWGVIAVFDGMGGAGARKYINKDTNEEHTSAYWASRAVRTACEKLLQERKKNIDPIQLIDSNMHRVIVEALNEEIKKYDTDSTLMSKMIRKLPTTMAMCAYIIRDGKVEINCYWAGDSRIYLFEENCVHFLTIDDANAPDNDPFSPANMDLAMNNTISQDRPFIIHKSTIRLDFIPEKPLLLLAATDGCFGYYKNPIGFDRMLRQRLLESANWEQWKEKIITDIKENGHHDDYSMAIVALGMKDNEFNAFQGKMSDIVSKDIFVEYHEWFETKIKKQVKEIQEQIDKIIQEMNVLKEQISTAKQVESRFNDAWNNDILIRIKNLVGLKKENIINISDIGMKQLKEMENGKNELIDKYTNLEKQLEDQKASLEKLQIEIEDENLEKYKQYKEQYVHIIENNCITDLTE